MVDMTREEIISGLKFTVEILIDDNGNFNEGLWLSNLLACAELLKQGSDNESEDNNVSNNN